MKNSFLVKFAVKLAFGFLKKSATKSVGSWILGGPIGALLGFFAEKFLGYMVDQGILVIDLGIMGAKVAMERKEYEEFATEAYARAKRKVYSEDEKKVIRQQYLDALSSFGSVGNGVRQSNNPEY